MQKKINGELQNYQDYFYRLAPMILKKIREFLNILGKVSQ